MIATIKNDKSYFSKQLNNYQQYILTEKEEIYVTKVKDIFDKKRLAIKSELKDLKSKIKTFENSSPKEMNSESKIKETIVSPAVTKDKKIDKEIQELKNKIVELQEKLKRRNEKQKQQIALMDKVSGINNSLQQFISDITANQEQINKEVDSLEDLRKRKQQKESEFGTTKVVSTTGMVTSGLTCAGFCIAGYFTVVSLPVTGTAAAGCATVGAVCKIIYSKVNGKKEEIAKITQAEANPTIILRQSSLGSISLEDSTALERLAHIRQKLQLEDGFLQFEQKVRKILENENHIKEKYKDIYEKSKKVLEELGDEKKKTDDVLKGCNAKDMASSTLQEIGEKIKDLFPFSSSKPKQE